MPQINVQPPIPREYRIIIFPVDFTDKIHRNVNSNHSRWQKPALLQNVFFTDNLNLVDANGSRVLSRSLKDYIRGAMPGLNLVGTVYDYLQHVNPHTMEHLPASTIVDGWYQFTLGNTERPYFGEGFPDRYSNFCTAFIRDRLGLENTLINEGYRLVCIVTGGGTSFARGFFLPNYWIAHVSLKNPQDPNMDIDPRYNWFGTFVHEFMHAVTGLRDFYGPNWEYRTTWDILANGDWLGAFPAPMTAWMTHMAGYAREETLVSKGESGRFSIPNPTSQSHIKMVILDNSSVGRRVGGGGVDELIIEYRKTHSGSPGAGGSIYDTRLMGMPGNNSSGLLVVDFDRLARGFFVSSNNRWGEQPAAFISDRENGIGKMDHYAIGPIVEIKRRDGMLGVANDTDANDIFRDGDQLLGSYPNEPYFPLKSSGNRDGDVLWELRNLREEPTDFSFDAQFQGTTLASEAIAAGSRWTSRGRPMSHGQNPNHPSEGYYYEGTHNSETALWFSPGFSPDRTDPSPEFGYLCEGSFLHSVSPTGERLTGRLSFGSAWGGQEVRLAIERLDDQKSIGGPPRGIVPLLSIERLSPSTRLDEFSVDLTEYAGLRTRITLTYGSGLSPDVQMGIVGAYFFRKADNILYDFVARSSVSSTVINEDTHVTNPEGVIGHQSNIKLVDGVTYGKALVMKPQSVNGGIAMLVSPSIRIPDGGAVLRATFGHSLASTGHSDGATVRFLLDDGVHRFPVLQWNSPFISNGNTYVSLAQTSPVFGAATVWGKGHAWRGEIFRKGTDPYLTWSGDWIRVGDFNGDGRDDIAVFTGADHPRVGVTLSTGSGFGPMTRWHDYFCTRGEYPLVGHFNIDNNAHPAHPKSDIITFTSNGEAYVGLSTGTEFVGTGAPWGTNLAFEGDIPVIGDVNNDGLDDLVIFSRINRAERSQGDVWVAINNGSSFNAPELWLRQFCIDEQIPLVGDLNGDGLDDIVSVDEDTGMIWGSLSNGTRFVPESWPGSSTGPRRLNRNRNIDPLVNSLKVSSYGPVPGPGLIDGPIPFLAKKQGVMHIIWFNRSSLVTETDSSTLGKVWTAPVVAAPLKSEPGVYNYFGTPQEVHPWLCIDDEWPLVGDFNGDNMFDIAAVVPTKPTDVGWMQERDGPELTRAQPKYPGDLYISPKEADLEDLGRIPPRLHRLAWDLSAFSGRDLTLEITVNAGPTADYDMIVWPDLKLYRKTFTPLKPTP